MLIPLKALEVLELRVFRDYDDVRRPTHSLDRLTLPRLHTLRGIDLYHEADGLPNALLTTLACNSTAIIRTLDLNLTDLYNLTPEVVEPLIPLLGKIVRLSWNPFSQYAAPADRRDAGLALLGAAHSLVTLSITMWATVDGHNDHLLYHEQQIEHTLFDTLVTLPSLHPVNLIIEAQLNHNHIVSFIKAHKPLQFLYIIFHEGGWKAEDLEVVRKAAEEACVAFTYW